MRQLGDIVRVGTPDDTVEEYHNKIGEITEIISGRPHIYKDIRYKTGNMIPVLDSWGHPTSEKEPEYKWRRVKHYTGPKYPVYIVTFEDKSLDLKWLPFKEEYLGEV